MTTFKNAVSIVLMSATLGACAGRPPATIPVVQGQDSQLDCNAITAEVAANNTRLQDLSRESGNKVAQNVAAGVAGLLIWPLWFAMDFQDASGKDTVALQARQNYLGQLAAQRHCGTPEAAR
jgi:hypothetical protein